jgi:hypothetical protein
MTHLLILMKLLRRHLAKFRYTCIEKVLSGLFLRHANAIDPLSRGFAKALTCSMRRNIAVRYRMCKIYAVIAHTHGVAYTPRASTSARLLL